MTKAHTSHRNIVFIENTRGGIHPCKILITLLHCIHLKIAEYFISTQKLTVKTHIIEMTTNIVCFVVPVDLGAI